MNANVKPSVANLSLRRALTWRLPAVAEYEPTRGDEIYIEENWEPTSELNRALRTSNKSDLQRITRTQTPLRFAWTFRARNITSGKAARVSTSGPPAAGLVVITTSGQRWSDEIAVIGFPDDGDWYEVTADIEVGDPFGFKALASRSVSNLYLQASTTGDATRSLLHRGEHGWARPIR